MVISGVFVEVLGVVGRGVMMGILLGGLVVVATRMGILELVFLLGRGAMSRSF